MEPLRGLILVVWAAAALTGAPLAAFATDNPAAENPGAEDPVDPHGNSSDPGQSSEKTAPSVDELLDRLSKSTSKKEAAALERQIVRAWNTSGSDTVDHMIMRAGSAIEARDFGVALQYLDTVVAMQPSYAEGWNMRATVYYLLDEYELSLSDIRQTLARQPRHFGALSGLGMIFRELDEPDQALEAFRQVLEVHPYFGKARQSVEKLEKEVEGEEI